MKNPWKEISLILQPVIISVYTHRKFQRNLEVKSLRHLPYMVKKSLEVKSVPQPE